MVIAAACGGSGVPASTSKAGVGVRVGVGEDVGVSVLVGEEVGVAEGEMVEVKVGAITGVSVAGKGADNAVQAVIPAMMIKPPI
jgi:hypothetical protein